MSEWKPGDVAMVRNEYGAWNRAILQVDFPRSRWQYGAVKQSADVDRQARPLVVIDPTSDDVDQLFSIRFRRDIESIVRLSIDDSQWARIEIAARRRLAEFASPKPEEPTQLGAVVEDSEGKRFIRVHETENCRWFRVGVGSLCTWEGVRAVTVISPGAPEVNGEASS